MLAYRARSNSATSYISVREKASLLLDYDITILSYGTTGSASSVVGTDSSFLRVPSTTILQVSFYKGKIASD